MVFMLNIVLRAFDRIFERIMGLHDFAEAELIAGVLIVGMVAQSKITKYPFYRFRVGVRADFQNFVTVGERRGFHVIVHEHPPSRKTQRFCDCFKSHLSV